MHHSGFYQHNMDVSDVEFKATIRWKSEFPSKKQYSRVWPDSVWFSVGRKLFVGTRRFVSIKDKLSVEANCCGRSECWISESCVKVVGMIKALVAVLVFHRQSNILCFFYHVQIQQDGRIQPNTGLDFVVYRVELCLKVNLVNIIHSRLFCYHALYRI